MGGMLLGTLIGVIVIPGLYYIFARMADGRTLIKHEADESLSESFVRQSEQQQEIKTELNRLRRILNVLTRKRDK